MTRGFGRLYAPDVRDRDYPLTLARRMAVAKPAPRKRQYTEGPLLDQGAKPWCVGAAALGVVQAAPIMVSPSAAPSMRSLYEAAQFLDEWPGEDYDGSSVRGGMKALQQRGHISGYVWADTRRPSTAVDQLAAFMNDGYGTVVIGTHWYVSMDDVGRNGFIVAPSMTETPIGGHAYRLNWYDVKRGGFLVINSWGTWWGHQRSGRAWMTRALLERLLGEDGEAAAPTEVKLSRG